MNLGSRDDMKMNAFNHAIKNGTEEILKAIREQVYHYSLSVVKK